MPVCIVCALALCCIYVGIVAANSQIRSNGIHNGQMEGTPSHFFRFFIRIVIDIVLMCFCAFHSPMVWLFLSLPPLLHNHPTTSSRIHMRFYIRFCFRFALFTHTHTGAQDRRQHAPYSHMGCVCMLLLVVRCLQSVERNVATPWRQWMPENKKITARHIGYLRNSQASFVPEGGRAVAPSSSTQTDYRLNEMFHTLQQHFHLKECKLSLTIQV